MINSDPTISILMAFILVVAVLALFALYRYQILSRVRRYTNGVRPDNLDYSVVFRGGSTDIGRLRACSGAIFPTADALVFIGASIVRPLIVEMPWERLIGWSVVGEFRGRPLHRTMISIELKDDMGDLMKFLFTLPRPEFWTSLISVAIKSVSDPRRALSSTGG